MANLEQALKLIQAGRYDDALEAFEPLLDLPGERPDALGHRAWLYRALGRYEDALGDYEKLIEENHNDEDAAPLRAETLLLAGRIEEAASAAAQVLLRDPFNPLAAETVIRCQGALRPEEAHAHTAKDAGDATIPVRINPVIETLEKDDRHFPASVSPVIGRLLYWLVRCTRPGLVLETGSYIGYSSLWIAQGLQDNGAGHLHSFDLFEEKPGYVSPVLGERADMLQVARGHVQEAGLAERVTFHPGDSSESIMKLFDSRETRFDLAFLDGDHRMRGCLKDWRAVDRLTAEGGLILFHDTMPQESGWLGPRYVIEELQKRAAGSYAWVNLPTVDGMGLALVQKRSPGASPEWWPSLRELATEYLFHRRVGWHRKK